MTENKVRAEVVKLRKRLKRTETGEFSEAAWDLLGELGIIADSIETSANESEAAEMIVEWMDKIDRAASSNGLGLSAANGASSSEDRCDDGYGDGEGRYFEVELGECERERQKAFAEVMTRYLAYNEDALGNREIANFRQDLLGDSLLSAEQAYALLESPAAQYFHASWFEEWGIPVVGHVSEVVGRYDPGRRKGEVDHRVTVRVDPPGITRAVRYAHPDLPALANSEEDRRACFIYKDNGAVVEPFERLRYRAKDGLKDTVLVWPGSLLDYISRFTAKWARMYKWEEEDMLWALLTGEAPRLSALKVNVRHSLGNQTTITLAVAPWVGADVVEKNYRKIQRQVLVRGNHAPERSIAVLRFVERVIREEGKRPTWEKLWRRWNREKPHWAYKDYRGLRQAYERTLKKVVHATYRMPEAKPSPAAEERGEAMRKRFINALEPQQARAERKRA